MEIGWLKVFEKRVVGGNSQAGPLLVRWILFRVPWFGVMVHKLCRNDHDAALHDHPWPFISVVLKNGYSEVTDMGLLTHKPALCCCAHLNGVIAS